jgi:hypothetical protein
MVIKILVHACTAADEIALLIRPICTIYSQAKRNVYVLNYLLARVYIKSIVSRSALPEQGIAIFAAFLPT